MSGRYDAPAPGMRAWERPSASSVPNQLNEPSQPKSSLTYSAPGSSGMNPASTVAFMFNMGYPPPPIALEPLRRLVEQITDGHGGLNVHNALYVCDEISRCPYRIAPAVLFVIQQRLHSSKSDRVGVALELLDFCVKNCGLEFIRHLNKEFMRSLSSVIKTQNFKERTLTGQMKRLEKYLTGAPTATASTDPRILKVRLMTLQMMQNWISAFKLYTNQIAPIIEAHRTLMLKGIQFPPASPQYVAKDASTIRGGDEDFDQPPPNVLAPPSSAPIIARQTPWMSDAGETTTKIEGFGSDPFDNQLPLTDKQFEQIESITEILRKEMPESEKVQTALVRCESLRPHLEGAYRELNSRVQHVSGRKLKCSNPAVTQLNALLSLDSEYKRHRDSRFLFGGGAGGGALDPSLAGPLSQGERGGSPPPRQGGQKTASYPSSYTADNSTSVSPGGGPPRNPVNLLDDLFDEEETEQVSRKELPGTAPGHLRAAAVPAAGTDEEEEGGGGGGGIEPLDIPDDFSGHKPLDDDREDEFDTDVWGNAP